MSPSRFSVEHPRVIAVATVAALLFGALASWQLPRQEDPAITWRLANVVTRLPGSSPERVEALVTDILERRIEEIDEVEHIYSVTRAGVSLIQVELSDAVTDAPPVWQKVRHQLLLAETQLPDGTIGPELDDEIMGTMAVLAAVVGENQTLRALKDAAQDIEDELRYLPATVSTELFGVQDEIIYVEPDQAQLVTYELSFDKLAGTLAARNVRATAGRVSSAGRQLVVEASGEYQRPSQIADTVATTTAAGRTVHVRDVATIRRGTIDPPEPLARFNGQRAVVVACRAQRAARLDLYGRQVEEVIGRLAQRLPEGIEIHFPHNLADYTQRRVEYLSQTLLLSVTFVFLSTLVFLGPRASLVVTLAALLTGAVVLAAFLLIGIPLHQMSAMAIIMALGMLVDNSIVVTEQIRRVADEGCSIQQAAAREPALLLRPLLASTLTTIAAFIPIYLLPGGTGEFVRAIPIGVAICLLASLLLSVTTVPWLSTLLLSSRARPLQERVPLSQRAADTVFIPLLRIAMRRPLFVLLPLCLVLVAAALPGLQLRRDFFSPVQRDQFVIDVFAPPGADLVHTEQLVAEVEDVARRDPDVTGTLAFVGRNAPLVFYNLTSQETYANRFAQVVIRVTHWQHTADVAARLQSLLNDRIAGAHFGVRIFEHGAPFIAPFEVRIRGDSIPLLRELGRRAANVLRQSPGVRNVRINYGVPVPALAVQVNEPVARMLGLSQSAIAAEVRQRLDGLPAGFLREGDEQIPIVVRLPEAARSDAQAIRSLHFRPTTRHGRIAFDTVARLEPDWETASIYRRDAQRTLSVLAYPAFGKTAAQVSAGFTRRLQELAQKLPAGYSLEFGGESEQRQEAESSLIRRAVYAVLLIVVVLVAEFHSIRLSLLILAMAPLCVGGVMIGLWVTNWPLNFMAIMGTVMLLGVAVNDAVILVDNYERRRLAGQDLETIIIDGTRERTRHVVVTTVTTIAGFLPLALSPSLLWPPMAIAMIGGLLLATVVTLVVIPTGYALLNAKLLSHKPQAWTNTSWA